LTTFFAFEFGGPSTNSSNVSIIVFLRANEAS